MWLNPALRRHDIEANLIGHMVLAYGELELLVANCLGAALGNQNVAMRMMFRILGETNRIEAADSIMSEIYEKAGLGGQYSLAMGATTFCIKLRNQYAHCHWADDEKAGLFFTDIPQAAKASSALSYWWRHVGPELLTEQAAYFDYAAEGLQFIEAEYLKRAGNIKDHAFPSPKAKRPPPRHNPKEGHIPPWLSPEEQQSYIAHPPGPQ